MYDVNDNQYKSGKGVDVQQAVITCLDRDEHSPMVDTFDIKINDAKASQYAKLKNQMIEVDVKTFEIFGGRLQARGNVVNLEAQTTKPAASGKAA